MVSLNTYQLANSELSGGRLYKGLNNQDQMFQGKNTHIMNGQQDSG